jgi:hypothetical protein
MAAKGAQNRQGVALSPPIAVVPTTPHNDSWCSDVKTLLLVIIRYIAHSKLAFAVTLIGLVLLFTYQLSIRNVVTIAPGAEPEYGFYVAVTPGADNHPFDLVMFNEIKKKTYRYELPSQSASFKRGELENLSYRIIGSTPSGQEIETIYSNDDYSFWSRYRVTPSGIQPLWQRNVGPGQMFAAIPLAIASCWLLFFLLRRWQPRQRNIAT